MTTGGRPALLVGLLLGCFLISLDQTMVGTAAPALTSQLQATTLYGWVISAYLVGMTLALPIAGRMVEVLPGRRVYLASVGLFLVGTGLCGLAPEIYTLIAARLVQGLGAGGIFAANSALCGMLFPPRDQGLILSYFGAVSGLAMTTGALAGGLLTDHASWRGVFLAVLPLGGLALVLMARMPALSPRRVGHLDGRGSLAMVGWCAPLLLLCSWVGSRHAFLIPVSAALVALVVLGLRRFLRIERDSREPLFDLHLLGNPSFVRASLASWCVGAFYTGALTYLPLFMEESQDVSAITAGYALSAEVLVSILSSYLVGRALQRTGRFKPFLVAGTMLCGGLLLWAGLMMDIHTPLWQLLVMMGLLGLGVGMLMPIYPVVVQNSASEGRIGTAISWVQFSLTLGCAMGTALLGVVMTLTLHASFQEKVPPELRHRLLGEVTGYVEEQDMRELLKERVGQLKQALTDYQTARKEGKTPEVPQPLARLLSADEGPHAGQLDPASVDRAEALVEEMIETVTDVTTAEAMRRVYLAAAGLAGLALLFSLWIPSVPLKTHLDSGLDEADLDSPGAGSEGPAGAGVDSAASLD